MQTTYENNRKQIEAAVDTHGTLYDIRHILGKKRENVCTHISLKHKKGLE